MFLYKDKCYNILGVGRFWCNKNSILH